MKKLTLAIIAMVTALCSFAAEDEQPIITFKTNIYDTYGASNSFTIRLGSKEKAWFDYDCGAGKNEVEVEPATFDTEASENPRKQCNADKLQRKQRRHRKDLWRCKPNRLLRWRRRIY